MRIQHVLAFAAAASLSLSAFAEPSVAPSSASASTVTVQAGVSPLYRLTPLEAQQMRGTFRLSDGRMLTVTNRSARLFVDIEGKQEELLPTGPNRFVTRDSGTRLAFNQVPYADEVVVNQAVR